MWKSGDIVGRWKILESLQEKDGYARSFYRCKCITCGTLRLLYPSEIKKSSLTNLKRKCIHSKTPLRYVTYTQQTDDTQLDVSLYTPEILMPHLFWDRFLKDLESLNDPLLTAFFNSYISFNTSLIIELPATHQFCDQIITSTEAHWKPLFQKHFGSHDFIIKYKKNQE